MKNLLALTKYCFHSRRLFWYNKSDNLRNLNRFYITLPGNRGGLIKATQGFFENSFLSKHEDVWKKIHACKTKKPLGKKGCDKAGSC
jgi:hypothetical protein